MFALCNGLMQRTTANTEYESMKRERKREREREKEKGGECGKRKSGRSVTFVGGTFCKYFFFF